MFCHIFHKKKEHHLVLIVSAAVALALLFVGAIAMDTLVTASVVKTSVSPAATRLAPPTVGEYGEGAREALAPFFVWFNSPASVSPADAVGLVDKAQADLLALRVPAERKDGHLAAVLLLDAWRGKLAAGASTEAERAATEALVGAYPWFIRE